MSKEMEWPLDAPQESGEALLVRSALDNLRVCQRQLDADGIEVGVSRQALNEAIAYIGRLTADRDFWKERFQAETRARIEAETLSRTGAVTEARRFKLGDRVTKIKGSSWTGRVVGFYSTALTPIGYAVESETEIGSVQIYPEAALKAAMEAGRHE